MKIVILDGFALNPGDISWNSLEKLGDVKVYDRTPADMIIERIGNAEIIITNKTVITKEVMGKAPRIKYIGVLATGYNNIDIITAKAMGITVCNVPAYSTNSVAQHTIALLLEICHHAGDHNSEVKNGAWTRSADFCFWNYPLIELSGKTLGIIGFGQIGQAVAKIAHALGMNVRAYVRTKKKEYENFPVSFVSMNDLLSQSDVISLHCPLNDHSQGMINKESIAKMKDGVIIINTSRGPLIVEDDLANALNSGKVYAAGVDVVSIEPIKNNNPLLHARNCIITPHIAWAPIESRKRLMEITADNLARFLSGSPINVVSK